jgi:hypothetical protein
MGMQYNRMLCWVRPHEKKELIKAVDGQFPLVFAKNYDDFENKITGDAYLVISFSRASKKVRHLIQNFPNNLFVFYEIQEKYIMSSLQYDIFEEPNIIKGQYGAIELMKNYLGVAPDLWEMRLRQIPYRH